MTTKAKPLPYDFYCWCKGPARSARLTKKGKTGGICPKHQAEQLAEVAKIRAEFAKRGRK